VRRRIIPRINFKRKSRKILILSKLTNIRKSIEAEVLKGEVSLFGR
jgi:hypothetical protein